MQSSRKKDSGTLSSTITRQALKDIINEEDQLGRSTGAGTSRNQLDKFRLSEAIAFLEAKLEKARAENQDLTSELSREYERREETLKLLAFEQSKANQHEEAISKLQKNNAFLKAKLTQLENAEKMKNHSMNQSEERIRKLTGLLKRRDQQLASIKKQSGECESKLEQSWIERLEKERLENKNNREALEEVKVKLAELKESVKTLECELKQKSTQVLYWEEKCGRAEDRASEAESWNQEIQKIVSILNEEKQEMLKEMANLKASNVRMKELVVEESADLSVYEHEIARILKQHLRDKTLLSTLNHLITQVLRAMDESWNRVFLSMLAR